MPARDGIVLRAGLEEVRVDPVGQHGQLRLRHALGPEIAGEAVADDGDPVGQAVDQALEGLGESDAGRIAEEAGLDGQVGMDVLDVDQDPGPAERPGPERREAELQRRRAQEEHVTRPDGQEVGQGPGGVDVPGQEPAEGARRARGPEPLHGEAARVAPGIEEAPELLSPPPRHRRHDLDLMTGPGQVASQLVHEDGRAAEIGQVVHRVEEDLHAFSGAGFSRAH